MNNKSLFKIEHREKDINKEIKDEDYDEINKDISKAISEMKKNKQDDDIDMNYCEEEEKILNIFDYNFFFEKSSEFSKDNKRDISNNLLRIENTGMNKNNYLKINICNNNYIINDNKNYSINNKDSSNQKNENNYLNVSKDSFVKEENQRINNSYKYNNLNFQNINNSFFNTPYLINLCNNKIFKNKYLNEFGFKKLNPNNKPNFQINKKYMINNYLNNNNQNIQIINQHITNNINNNNSNPLLTKQSLMNNNLNFINNNNYFNNNNPLDNINLNNKKKIYINNNNNPCSYPILEKDIQKTKNLDSPNNIINIDNILKNKDKRTTLIIRNIPNKYTISLLSDELNKNFQNKFDIIYLPRDYINNSNLGYGFINFINHMHLILFYEEFEGKKWNNYNSKKRCQLAYSKYQGRNELMEYIHNKFGINFLYNNIDIIKQSFFINKNININIPIELPEKYYNNFISYYPFSLIHKKDDKIFVIDKYYNISNNC